MYSVTRGEVYKKKTASEIYERAKESGQNAALTSRDEKKDSSFNTKFNIPPGENAFLWLTYEQQLARTKGRYKYSTNLKTYDEAKAVEVKVRIRESRPIKGKDT